MSGEGLASCIGLARPDMEAEVCAAGNPLSRVVDHGIGVPVKGHYHFLRLAGEEVRPGKALKRRVRRGIR